MIHRFTDMLCDTRAQGLLEYALIIAFIAMVVIAALTFLGSKTMNSLNNSQSKIPG